MSLLLAAALSYGQEVPVSMSTDPTKSAAICATVALMNMPTDRAALIENNNLINAWTGRYAKLAGIPDDDHLMDSPQMLEASNILSAETDTNLNARLSWCRAHKPAN